MGGVAISPNGGSDPGPVGFRMPDRLTRYEGEAGSDLEGFWIEVKALRYGAEVRALLAFAYWGDLHEFMAPYVVKWNWIGPALEIQHLPATMLNGKELLPERDRPALMEALAPPPAEAGPDAFGDLPVSVRQWIRTMLIGSAYDRQETKEEGKAERRPSADTPDGTPSETDATDPPTETSPTTTGRKRRPSRGS